MVREWEEKSEGFSWFLGIVVYGIFLLVNVHSIVFSPVHWIAAFGNPELLIATRALEAAGAL